MFGSRNSAVIFYAAIWIRSPTFVIGKKIIHYFNHKIYHISFFIRFFSNFFFVFRFCLFLFLQLSADSTSQESAADVLCPINLHCQGGLRLLSVSRHRLSRRPSSTQLEPAKYSINQTKTGISYIFDRTTDGW